MNWPRLPLREIAEVRTGSPAPQGQEYFKNGKYPFVRVQDVGREGRTTCLTQTKDRINKKAINELRPAHAKAGTIVFPKSGAAINTNSRAILGINAYVVSHLTMIYSHEDKVLSEWLYYWLCSYDMTSLCRTTSLPSVRLSDIKELQIPVPAISEQRRIVACIKECLDRVDEIQLLRIASLKESENLEGAIFADFLNELDVPVVPLGEIISHIQYGTSGKANIDSTGVPILRMGNIQNGYLDTTGLKYIELPEREIQKYSLNEGDILFNRTNSLEKVGKAAVFKRLKGRWVYLIRLIIDKNKAVPEYVNGLINSRLGREFILRTARRAIGMVNINAKEIQKFEIPLTSLNVQKSLIQKIETVRSYALEIRKDLTDGLIGMLPTSILHKAFSGEL
jgi:restriction endonuclease S subunit